MPSQFDVMFEQSAAPQHDLVFGVSVTLTGNSGTSAAFTATFEDQEYQAMDFETGGKVIKTYRLWVFAVSDSVIASVEVEPVAGMYITDGSDQWEIVPVDNKPAVELNEGGYRWLARTQKVS